MTILLFVLGILSMVFLTVMLIFYYDFMSEFSPNENFEEYSVETRLMFPRFIAPFIPKGFRRRNTATSEVSLLYDLQNRPEYHRRVLSLAWKYKWNDVNHHDRYQVDLLHLNYL